MALEKRVFTYEVNLEDGEYDGWRPDFGLTLEPGDAEVVAHYAVDHLPEDTGTFAQKLTAVGRMWYTRIEPGYEASRRNCEIDTVTLLTEAIVNCAMREMLTRDARHILVSDPPQTRELYVSREERLKTALRMARCFLYSYFAKIGISGSAVDTALGEANLEAFAWCLRKGYRNGEYRSSARCQQTTGIVDTLVRAVNVGLPFAKAGDKLKVEFDSWKGTVSVIQLPDAGLGAPLHLA